MEKKERKPVMFFEYTESKRTKGLEQLIAVEHLGFDSIHDTERFVLDNINESPVEIERSDETAPVKIDIVMNILEKLKAGGAEFVEIEIQGQNSDECDDDCDNCAGNTYLFNGLNIRLATDDEVETNMDKQARMKLEIIDSKTDQLKRLIDFLENERITVAGDLKIDEPAAED